ncbi:conserved hypothetical protein [Dehalogenimonas lykanthroporepellens BL-DC-9]|nr:conserved hypothetical protein [Dehalogenimonas lykanthroporepellens BL-DC-9]
MRDAELVSQLQSIQSLINKSGIATNDDIEMRGHWARYLCVLCAGLLENAIGLVYRKYINDSSNPKVADFSNSVLSKITNPNMKKFIEVHKIFDILWAEELEAFSDENGGKEAIDAIMANRHRIVHGKSSDISIARIDEYLKRAIKIIEFMESQIYH